MPRSRKAISRVKKSEKNATVERRVHRSKMKVNMNHPIRYKPKELRKVSSLIFARPVSISKPPGVKMMAKDNQNPPYDDSAVAPKVLPTAISLEIVRLASGWCVVVVVGVGVGVKDTYHMPASS